ncbi:hypothetical protein ACFE04_019694 [Oxalis oulophora]
MFIFEILDAYRKRELHVRKGRIFMDWLPPIEVSRISDGGSRDLILLPSFIELEESIGGPARPDSGSCSEKCTSKGGKLGWTPPFAKMCFHIVSFRAQVVESLKGLGQEHRRQVVPSVVHAHLEELFLAEFIIPLLGLELRLAPPIAEHQPANLPKDPPLPLSDPRYPSWELLLLWKNR